MIEVCVEYHVTALFLKQYLTVLPPLGKSLGTAPEASTAVQFSLERNPASLLTTPREA
jgi:hypothetical protein